MSGDGKEGYASLRAARIINSMPGGQAVLCVLKAHGFNQVEARDLETGKLLESCSIDRMLEEKPQ